MNLSLSAISSRAAKNTTESGIAMSCALHSQSLSHDGASAGKDLQVGHGPSTGRSGAGGGGKRAEGGGRSFIKKRAHGAALSQKGLHVELRLDRALNSSVNKDYSEMKMW